MAKEIKRATSSAARNAVQQDHAVQRPVDYPFSDSAESSERYSRETAAQRYTGASRGKRMRNNSRMRVVTVLLAVLVTILAGLLVVQCINGRLSGNWDMSEVLVQAELTKEPFYMVLLGTDESLDRNENNSTDGVYRTDTIILARVDAPNKQATLVSMQRDTQVNLPGHGVQKLNAAYTFGGPPLAVSTVADIAGVGIAHYALIDMNGMQDVVNALGGIEVNVPMEIWDDDAGGHLEAGPQTLDGWQALILCRARNAYADYGNGDMYRAANQRLVIQAIAKKILASDPLTIANTINALSGAVKTDLTVNEIIALAQAFEGLDTENNLWTGNMPTESIYEDDLWYEIILEPEWQNMMERVKAGLPPTEDSYVDPLSGTVLANAGNQGASGQSGGDLAMRTGVIAVRNGSGVDGLAATVQRRLEMLGYTVSDIGNADADDYDQTVVVYEDDSRAEEAALIVADLGEGRVVKNDYEYIMSEDFLVVIGKDYATNED